MSLFEICLLVMTRPSRCRSSKWRHPSHERHVKPGNKLLAFQVNVWISHPCYGVTAYFSREDTDRIIHLLYRPPFHMCKLLLVAPYCSEHPTLMYHVPVWCLSQLQMGGYCWLPLNLSTLLLLSIFFCKTVSYLIAPHLTLGQMTITN